MATKTGTHRLTLEFTNRKAPRLVSVEFWLASSDRPTLTPDNDVKQLEWCQGTQGMSLCLLTYKMWALAKDKASIPFPFEADEGPGASFANAVKKNPTWVKNAFADPDRKKLVYNDIFKWKKSDPGKSPKPRAITIDERLLPPEAVTINWDGQRVHKAELKELKDAIQTQWEPHHNLGRIRKDASSPVSTPTSSPVEDGAQPKPTLAPPGPASIQEQRETPPASGSATVTTAGPSETNLPAPPGPEALSPGSKTSAPPSASNTLLTAFLAEITSPRPNNYLSEAAFRYFQGLGGTVINGRGKRPLLVEFYRPPSLRTLYGYIKLKLTVAEDPAALLDKVLEPKWINLIAGKLTASHVKAHNLFYRHFQAYGSDKIKHAVSDVIEWNPVLGDQMIKNVLTCCDSCIESFSEWLSASADFYSMKFVKRFEIPLLLALDTPTTRKWLTHYSDYALPSLTDCLAAFTKAEAYNGVRAIVRICLQNGLFFLRKGLEKNGKDSVLSF